MTNELEQPTTEHDAALLRLKKRRDLQGHLVAYIVVNAAVWAVWAVTGAGDLWLAWLTGICAIGLVMNAWDVYFRAPITKTDVSREIERLDPQR
jgi:2TM domain